MPGAVFGGEAVARAVTWKDMGSSEEVDPLAELREGEGSDAEAAATAAPPPLPPRRSTSVALRPAMTLPAVRMPVRPSSSMEAADPFGEPTEPPAPPEGSLPERLDYFRTVLRQKVETLQRARTLYAEREAELRTVRISETTLRGQLVEAQGQIASLKTRPAQKDSGAAQARVARLEAELLQVEEDRKDLARSLADVEAELGRVRARAQEDSERAASAEARVAELEGELTAVDADRQDLSRSLADVEAELGRVRDQSQQESGRAAVAEARVAELEAELKTMEADRQDLSRALADVEAELGRLRGEEEAPRDKGQVPEENNPASSDLIAERDQLREDVATMKRKLMVAETALEAAASYKMKVARLEAQLAQLRGEK